jgi:hypothetical protein
MAVFVWVMTGIAVWHFAVFVPERFVGGIVGAFMVAWFGAVVFGLIFRVVTGGDLTHADIATMFEAAFGAVIALGASWMIGSRRGEEPIAGK